jgi:hypothetical protein
MMFEPLLYHMKIAEKGWDRWSDNTSVLMLSIAKDKTLLRDQRMAAQRQVCGELTLTAMLD